MNYWSRINSGKTNVTDNKIKKKHKNSGKFPDEMIY